jgi:hypothetical protein
MRQKLPGFRGYAGTSTRSPRWGRRHPNRAFRVPRFVRSLAKPLLYMLGGLFLLGFAGAVFGFLR